MTVVTGLKGGLSRFERRNCFRTLDHRGFESESRVHGAHQAVHGAHQAFQRKSFKKRDGPFQEQVVQVGGASAIVCNCCPRNLSESQDVSKNHERIQILVFKDECPDREFGDQLDLCSRINSSMWAELQTL